MKYYPYGECRNSTGDLGTDKLFTGQRLDDTGLYYYGARYYDPTIGRFISADTIVPDSANPQAFNRYAYVLNNPLRYTDPTGKQPGNASAWDPIELAYVTADPSLLSLAGGGNGSGDDGSSGGGERWLPLERDRAKTNVSLPAPKDDIGKVIAGAVIVYGAALTGEAAAAAVVLTAIYVPGALPVVVPAVEAFEVSVVFPAMTFGFMLIGEGLHWWDVPWIE